MKKLKRILSVVMIATMLFGMSTISVNASEQQEKVEDVIVETLSEKEISLEEYKEILISEEGFSEKEAEARIASHIAKRGPTVKLYSVNKSKTKVIKGTFKLQCKATVYVWRTYQGENVEIDHITAPHVAIIGPIINSSYSGNQEASVASNKKSFWVDYNGVFYFTTNKGVSVGFGYVSASTSTTISYGYSTSGKFNWALSEI